MIYFRLLVWEVLVLIATISFHCNTLHSIDFWMGIDSTSVADNTCEDNCTK
uniref:Uncharacterized protein n=1 Tax=Rhodnius prolixus TaxID=13249 RepID=T1I6T2_RHOPR